MRNYLLSVAAKLPHLKTIPEVFPKQTKLGLDKDGKSRLEMELNFHIEITLIQTQ